MTGAGVVMSLALFQAGPALEATHASRWPTVRPTALIQIDATASGLDAVEDFNLRRGRLGLSGELSPHVAYGVNFELGGGAGDTRGRLNNLWLEYGGDGIRIRGGIFGPSQPFEGSTPNLLFLERASPAAIHRSLSGGSSSKALGVFANGRRWTASASLVAGPVYDIPRRSPLAINARFAALVRSNTPLLHLGVNSTYVARPEDGRVRLSDRGETRSTEYRQVDTGGIEATDASAVAIEAGAQWRKLTAQAEYIGFNVDTAKGGTSANFHGWYVSGVWAVHGAGRRYQAASGSFEKPRPERSFSFRSGRGGAVELGVRYSSVDLGSSNGDIAGGRQRVLGGVLNWYPHELLRLQGLVQHLSTRSAIAAGAPEQQSRLVAFRTQLALP